MLLTTIFKNETPFKDIGDASITEIDATRYIIMYDEQDEHYQNKDTKEPYTLEKAQEKATFFVNKHKTHIDFFEGLLDALETESPDEPFLFSEWSKFGIDKHKDMALYNSLLDTCRNINAWVRLLQESQEPMPIWLNYCKNHFLNPEYILTHRDTFQELERLLSDTQLKRECEQGNISVANAECLAPYSNALQSLLFYAVFMGFSATFLKETNEIMPVKLELESCIYSFYEMDALREIIHVVETEYPLIFVGLGADIQEKQRIVFGFLFFKYCLAKLV